MHLAYDAICYNLFSDDIDIWTEKHLVELIFCLSGIVVGVALAVYILEKILRDVGGDH